MASSASNKDITGKLLCPDILLKVFKHLSTSDLLAAARVCKEWKNTVDCKTSWRGRHVCVNLMRELDERFIFTLEQREIEHLILLAPHSALISLAHIMKYRIGRIMQCFSPTLRELKILNRHLNRTDINVLFCDKMEYLEKLEFCCVSGAAERGLIRVSEQCPNLQHLNPNVAIPPSLIRTLGTNMPNLRTINFTDTNDYDNAAMKDIRTYMPNLESLSLSRGLVDDEGILQLALMHGLISLELHLCLAITPEAIKLLAKSPIKKLVLNRCPGLDINTDLVLSYIGQYSLGIKELHLMDNIVRVTDVGLQGLIATTPSPLENLYFDCISNSRSTEQAILDVIRNSPNLLQMKSHECEVNIPLTIRREKLEWK